MFTYACLRRASRLILVQCIQVGSERWLESLTFDRFIMDRIYRNILVIMQCWQLSKRNISLNGTQ
jgi:hypothetical protein